MTNVKSSRVQTIVSPRTAESARKDGRLHVTESGNTWEESSKESVLDQVHLVRGFSIGNDQVIREARALRAVITLAVHAELAIEQEQRSRSSAANAAADCIGLQVATHRNLSNDAQRSSKRHVRITNPRIQSLF
jgi:hypothetical protein